MRHENFPDMIDFLFWYWEEKRKHYKNQHAYFFYSSPENDEWMVKNLLALDKTRNTEVEIFGTTRDE